jgi:hypothetical protein
MHGGCETVYIEFPNVNEQLLILKMRGYKILLFDDQKIYRNRLCFKRHMKFLHDIGLVVKKEDRKGNQYRLSVDGEKVADMLSKYINGENIAAD